MHRAEDVEVRSFSFLASKNEVAHRIAARAPVRRHDDSGIVGFNQCGSVEYIISQQPGALVQRAIDRAEIAEENIALSLSCLLCRTVAFRERAILELAACAHRAHAQGDELDDTRGVAP